RDAGIFGRQKARLRNQQQRRVELARAVVLHERVALGVERFRADLLVDLGANLAPSVDGSLELEPFAALDAAVESDPAHDPRMRERTSGPARFPDPVVGLLPRALELAQQRLLQCPGFVERS